MTNESVFGGVVSFCSVGRDDLHSMPQACVAMSLARQGLRVLVVDWCLARPGIDKLFKWADGGERCGGGNSGLVDWLAACSTEEEFRWREHVISVRPFGDAPAVDILPAGSYGSDAYPRQLGSIDLDGLFVHRGLGTALEAMRSEWIECYDVTLVSVDVDRARGIGAIHLPDVLVAVFVPLGSDGIAEVQGFLRRAVAGHAGLPFDRRRLITVPVVWPRPDVELIDRQLIASEMEEFVLDWVPSRFDVLRSLEQCSLPGRLYQGDLREGEGALASLSGSLVGVLSKWRGRKVSPGSAFRLARGEAPAVGGGVSGLFSCRECIDVLRAYLDGELTPEEQAHFKAHLQDCPPCVEFLESYRSTPALSKKALTAKMPEELSQKLVALLQGALKRT